jgi:hypothetical protein
MLSRLTGGLRARWASALLSTIGLLAAFVPAGGPSSLAGATAAPGHGEFIVRCKLASTTAFRVDPILNRTGPSGHNHVFFGNTNIPAVAATGNFAGLTDARLEPSSPGQTNCADLSDGTGEWVPELFYDGAQRLYQGGNPANGAIYTRTYYLSDDQNVANPPGVNVPDLLQMINGYPTATAPPVINATNVHDYLRNVFWDCSANGGATPPMIDQSPHSPWPYSCTAWAAWARSQGLTPPADDGIVAHIEFPNCLVTGSDHNMDGGPLYVPAGVPGTNDLVFGDGTMNGCPSGTVPIPFISERLHTLIDDPTAGAVVDPLVARGSTWSGQPSCHSPFLSDKTASGTTVTAPCTNTPPQAGDLRLGFASDADPTGATCGLPVASTCGYFTVHGDYMQMWQQVNRTRLDTGAGGADPAGIDPQVPPGSGNFAPVLEDTEEDCLWGTEAHTCGFIPTTSNLSGG